MNLITSQNLNAKGLGFRDVALERRLARNLEGEAHFDAFTRGRYSTDASIYQIAPIGVVFPKHHADIEVVLTLAAEAGVSVTMRGGGTSQNGQPLGYGLVVDCSRYLNNILDVDLDHGSVTVEPGVVLEQLNVRLREQRMFFPVEPSTASRCTVGGMAGNNSSGARSLRYGKMVDNVLEIEGLLSDSTPFSFSCDSTRNGMGRRPDDLSRSMVDLAQRERNEIERMYPNVQRRVGGYNLDALLSAEPNMAHLLVGSEGTLAVSTRLKLKISPLPSHRVMGVCHFPSFRAAMDTTRHLVALAPTAVELVDNNILVLGADIPLFQRTLSDITKGTPNCLLLVEFAGSDAGDLHRDLTRLDQCMADHGFPDSVVEVVEPERQRQVWDVREACLNIMMSMRGDAKPISFIEDCAVPLDRLADYTDAITDLFERYGTRGTWYAHASVGCLHVRPILNMKSDKDIRAMREIAEAACDLVKKFKGSFSGEHGDGISRSEFNETMFGSRLARAFEAVKDSFDPASRLNPGKIVRAYRMDDKSLMRFGETYAIRPEIMPALDWSEWGGFGGAVEMCNNNGTCRKSFTGAMCPSYRITSHEKHVTRGRANTLRLAISGQLGPDAFTSKEMKETLDLCVSCKSCRRECPTGVDMAKMKVEFLHHYHAKHGLSCREWLVAFLPRYARFASSVPGLMNLRNKVPALAALGEKMLGLSARRSLPSWGKPWREKGAAARPSDMRGDGRDIVLFADTFNRYFEKENLEAAVRVLTACGYRIHRAVPADKGHPLCCGRTYLSAGLIDKARIEAQRTLDTLSPFVAHGARIVGLEPSCLLTFRDEFKSLLPGEATSRLAQAAVLFEELLDADAAMDAIQQRLVDQDGRVAHLHGHCHQKAFDVMGSVEAILRRLPGIVVKPIQSSCCGMAGAFGYGAETIDASLKMAELSLFPALRKASKSDIIVADGTSCRHQIHDGMGLDALHVSRVIDEALMKPYHLRARARTPEV